MNDTDICRDRNEMEVQVRVRYPLVEYGAFSVRRNLGPARATKDSSEQHDAIALT